MTSSFLERFKNRIQKINKEGDFKLREEFSVLPPIRKKKLHFDSITPTSFFDRRQGSPTVNERLNVTLSQDTNQVSLYSYSMKAKMRKKLSSSVPRNKNIMEVSTPVNKRPTGKYLSPDPFQRYNSFPSKCLNFKNLIIS